MNKYPSNPDARSPLYEGAMTLREAQAGTQFLTFQTSKNQMWVTTLASDWRVDEFIGPLAHEGRTVIADDTEGQVINLATWGIHSDFHGRWSNSCFSVVVTKESILALHAWAKKQGRALAAEHIEEMFFELFTDSWDDLLK